MIIRLQQLIFSLIPQNYFIVSIVKSKLKSYYKYRKACVFILPFLTQKFKVNHGLNNKNKNILAVFALGAAGTAYLLTRKAEPPQEEQTQEPPDNAEVSEVLKRIIKLLGMPPL